MRKENPQLTDLVHELKKKSLEQKVNIWKRIALDLEKPTKRRRIVNLWKINKYTNENETVIVPGKVLGTGELDKNIVVAAFDFSQSALDKINKVGKALTIKQLVETNPKGVKVRILG